MAETGTMRVKSGLAEMLKGGVIMDVTNAEQARIAEDAGACAVMALERVPADIRRDGGVARMADPTRIREIQETVTIPVMAKARIGHFVEAQILEALEVDYIDESEVLTPADEANHINKWDFKVPFVCGATNLGEALRRISEGAAMIRSKGEAGTGNVVEAVRHMRSILGEIRKLQSMDENELYAAAKEHRAPYELVRFAAENGRLPVVTFTAGGLATPGRRRDDDAAGRRRRVRRLRHLQERRSGPARGRDRQGHHPLQRPGRAGRGVERPGRAHGRHRDVGAGRGRPAADAWLVGPESSPCRGRSASTAGRWPTSVWSRSRCASRATWRGWTGWSSPAASRPRCRS